MVSIVLAADWRGVIAPRACLSRCRVGKGIEGIVKGCHPLDTIEQNDSAQKSEPGRGLLALQEATLDLVQDGLGLLLAIPLGSVLELCVHDIIVRAVRGKVNSLSFRTLDRSFALVGVLIDYGNVIDDRGITRVIGDGPRLLLRY